MNRLTTLMTTTLVLSALSGCAAMDDARYKRTWRGKSAPDFELTALDGKKVRLHDFRGKPVLLTFWGNG